MKQELKIGGTVIFLDENRQESEALVVSIHGDPKGRLNKYEQGENVPDEDTCGQQWPCINLVFVSKRENSRDQYGRQLERHSSVVHHSFNSALGMCYRFRDEVLDRSKQAHTIS